MRKLLCLLLVAAALAGAGGARADIGPPVQVRILGEPRAAEPGVPFKGQLQIQAGAPLVLEDLMFSEEGWDQLSLAAGPQVGVDKARPQVVDFEVVTDDPGRPLVLSFSVDGFPVTRTFDLSPAGVAFARGPNPVSKVEPAGEAPAVAGQAPAPPAPLPAAEGAVTTPKVGEKGRNIRVHGRFTYVRSDGQLVGAYGVGVRVHDNDYPFGAPELAAVSTDGQGYYDVTFWWGDDLFDPQPDLYVTFEAANTRVLTQAPTWSSNDVYNWTSGQTNDFGGTDLDLGWLQPSDVNQHPALHVQTDLTRTWAWWTGYGYDTPMVRANWPNGANGAFYNGEIYISTGEQWWEQTHTHEYGHHWVGVFAQDVSPQYCNGICDDSPTDCGHCLWCAETANISFTEGFPDWMGDVIPKSFQAGYGLAPLASYDMENVLFCNNASYRDPLLTEGNFAAVVRDIGDATNDDDDYPETDELALGWGPAITCVDLDHPTTAAGFLTAFRNRYLSDREGLWATAKNCGYEIDAAVPLAPAGLTSTSHSTSGDSADPTIDFAWTRAYDDASGIEGYGITIATGYGLPSAVMDIGDVTTYTTPSLTPGTYYFSIRTLDRAGKWSTTYSWVGPYVIRSPVPANLVAWQFSGWDRIMVPRPTADGSYASVPAPATLPGNAAGTYWNVSLRNVGEASTGSSFWIAARADATQVGSAWSGAIGAATNQYGVNLGPVTVRGGRHTFESLLDSGEQVAETNEGDNRWAHQWVWSPLVLTPDTWITRGAPPLKTGGWDAVTDGSTLYVNSDGLRLDATSWWDAMVLRPLAADADYDLYLHAASTGATDGFATSLASSARGSGVIDAVIVNRNVVGWDDYDVGAINYNGKAASYEVVHQTSSFMSYGDSTTVAYAQNQMLRVWEVYIGPTQVGNVSVTVDVAPANGPVVACWLDKTFQRGAMYNASASATSDDSGRARLDLNVTESGYYALVVYRDPTWSKTTGAMNVTIEIDRTPVDFLPVLVAGWYAPIVPRAAEDGTPTSVPAPTTLPGNVGSTYLNVAVRNESPTSAPNLPAEVYLDGGSFTWAVWGAFPANTTATYNWPGGWTVRGGRHTLAWKLDVNQEQEEIHEDNNTYGEQWVWSPLDVAYNTPVHRDSPPDPYGDWSSISTAETAYPNCDGLRMPDTGGYWHAVAVMPDAGSDVDLRLHQPSTGAKDGFAENLAGSYWGTNASDYVLVNFNLTGFQAYDVGAVKYAGSGGYTTESAASGSWISNPNGIYGPYTMAANRILDLYELYLPAGPFGIHLMNQAGNVDWGVALHRADLVYQGKSDNLGVALYGFGQGQDELLEVNVPTAGWYCVAVFKTGTSTLADAGTYKLLMKPMWATGVDDGVPAVTTTALVDISPNPFNPQTKITFDLAREGRVQLEIYDLQGRRVRTLVDGQLGVGRHTGNWNGVDDAGGKVASGLYMARLTADGRTQMMKMTLLK